MPPAVAPVRKPALEEVLPGQVVAVLGAGVSGRSAARLLASLGREVVLLDDADRSADPEVRDLLAGGATARWGKNPDFAGIDAIVVSPGFPENHPALAAARERSLPALGEFELAWLHTGPARTIAVTGTNGKTTVTMMIRHILECAGIPVVETGNIGYGFCDAVRDSRDRLDGLVFVAEASSFQLEDCRFFAPEVAVLLNVTPDHLDRHGTMENYAAAKAKATALQTREQTLVANLDDAIALRIASETNASVLRFSTERPVEAGAWLDCERLTFVPPGGKPKTLLDLAAMQLIGMHNVSNALASACAAMAIGVPHKAIGPAIESFGPAQHRLETIAEIDGVRYVNDSKATNIDAMAKAIESFATPVRLIAGGRDKDSPFEAVAALLEDRVERAYLIGEAAEKMERAWGGRVSLARSGTMERAIEDATADAREGDVVLLAPGCASFDQFKDYKHRGEAFAEIVRRIAARRTAS